MSEVALFGLVLVIALGVAVVVSELAGRRFRLAPLMLLLTCGALLGFVPESRQVQLLADVLLLLFLLDDMAEAGLAPSPDLRALRLQVTRRMDQEPCP